MKRRKIFLSYRRDDNPGYVKTLQEDLQRRFGEGNVFRDVENIAGGDPWKQVLKENLARSAALVVIIGPRWEEIWNQREDKSNDYLVYELNEANRLGVTIIPLTINGTELSDQLDLGPISWLRDKHQHDISDRQGRWSSDVNTLVEILGRQKGLRIIKEKSYKKLLLIPSALALLAVIGYLSEEDPVLNPDPVPVANLNTDLTIETPEPVASAALSHEQPATYPDVSGVWQDEYGAIYMVSNVMNGQFTVSSAESQAQGQFIPGMPRKFSVVADGIGHGEYSITTDNQRLVGWFIGYQTGQTVYATLWRVEQ